MDPLSFLYYFAPVSTLAVGIVASTTEWRGDILGRTGEVWSHVRALHPAVFVANGAMAFSLNLVITVLVSLPLLLV